MGSPQHRNARRIGVLFSDYDGTLAPSDVSRDASSIPEPTLSRLVELSSRIPIAVITSKDYGFIEPRTRAFARAWACASGLDIRLRGNGTKELFEATEIPDISPSLAEIEAGLPRGVTVERKYSSGVDGRLLGFCIDWTTGPGLDKSEIESITRRLVREGFHVSHLPWQKYIDVFATRPNKGFALEVLAKELGVSGRALAYLGDSETDNDAFDRADIAVGIDHGQPVEMLRCRYLLASEDIPAFLQDLLENDLRFSPEGSGLRRSPFYTRPLRT